MASLSLTPPGASQYHSLKVSSIREKLLATGLKRDTSAHTDRTSVGKNVKRIRSVKLLDIDRLSAKYNKYLAVIPSPIRLTSKTSRSAINIPEVPKVSGPRLTKSKPDQRQCADFILKLWNSATSTAIFTEELSIRSNHISTIPESPFKEKLEYVVEELKNLNIGCRIPINLLEHIEDLAVLLGIPVYPQQEELKNPKDIFEALKCITNMFTVRRFSEIKINLRDTRLFQALIIITGGYEQKIEKNEFYGETVKRFLANPGLAVRQVRGIPALLKSKKIDKGKK